MPGILTLPVVGFREGGVSEWCLCEWGDYLGCDYICRKNLTKRQKRLQYIQMFCITVKSGHKYWDKNCKIANRDSEGCVVRIVNKEGGCIS